ncbi:MAG: glycine cleavage system aminomethyltransferase GcvT [Proteobacteria bacterium]|nr:glycine cleavage system aminomethyltransferase GcvT [Pseudomonadota bacterium]
MSLRRTPLYDAHVALGGRMVEFAGFDMPVQYGSILEEHAAVRERVGLFDVSHMGQIHLSGPKAVEAAERLVSCPVASLRVGRVRYGLLCNEEGGVVDDVTVYRVADDALFLCVNAANIEKDYRWLVRHAPAEAGVRNRSDETGLLALQGPASGDVLAAVGAGAAAELKRFAFASLEVAGVAALVSRTGYTGSAGFEIYAEAGDCAAVFSALLDKGEALGLRPAGLGARDTLRLEAALPLYGHELDDTTSPLEAGLGRFVKREAGGFIGAEAIERRAAAPAVRQLAGFELEGRGVARAGYPILESADEGAREVGTVTSGAPSPTLGKSIGLGYVPPALAELGGSLTISIRGRGVQARVVATPFVVAGR